MTAPARCGVDLVVEDMPLPLAVTEGGGPLPISFRSVSTSEMCSSDVPGGVSMRR